VCVCVHVCVLYVVCHTHTHIVAIHSEKKGVMFTISNGFDLRMFSYLKF